MKKIFKRVALLLLCLILLCTFVACSGKGQVLLTLADKSMSLNEYRFLLSRMKGSLASYGYSVNSESFWRTVISSDGMTYADYFETSILQEASAYLISDYLFDRNGLVFTSDDEAKIDKLMDSLVEYSGSKTALNSTLKSFGVNYEMLKDIYVSEAKMALLKSHLYGENGEKLSKEDKETYLEENYVAFGQIFLATYYYAVDTDEFGDDVYYTDDKHTAICYDKENGRISINEFGDTETDIFGDTAYFTEAGRVAYDKENGVKSYILDEDGDNVMLSYDDEKAGEIFNTAAKYSAAANGDIELFSEYAELYDESLGEGKHNYLFSSAYYYESQGESFAYLDEIATKLSAMEVGQCAVVRSDFGCHIVCKYSFEEDPYDKEEYKDIFSDFYEGLADKLFSEECKEYEDAVKINAEVLKEAPSIEDVTANILY